MHCMNNILSGWQIYRFNFHTLEGGPELGRFFHMLQSPKKSLFFLGTTSPQGDQIKKSPLRGFASFSE